MRKRNHTVEQIIVKLREIEVLCAPLIPLREHHVHGVLVPPCLMQYYNTVRPHSSLGDGPPAPQAIACTA
jgi:hypothetical protein